MAAALSTALPGTSYVPGAPGTGFDSSGATWRPRGVLVAHLAEHRQAVNQLAIANSRSFFVSASSDGTVKVRAGEERGRLRECSGKPWQVLASSGGRHGYDTQSLRVHHAQGALMSSGAEPGGLL